MADAGGAQVRGCRCGVGRGCARDGADLHRDVNGLNPPPSLGCGRACGGVERDADATAGAVDAPRAAEAGRNGGSDVRGWCSALKNR